MHPNAQKVGITLELRRKIREAVGTDKELAVQFGVSIPTIRRWRQRDTEEDRSHRPRRLRASALRPDQLAVLIRFRQEFGWSLDLLTRAAQALFTPAAARSSIHESLVRAGCSKATPGRHLFEEDGESAEYCRAGRIWVTGGQGAQEGGCAVYFYFQIGKRGPSLRLYWNGTPTDMAWELRNHQGQIRVGTQRIAAADWHEVTRALYAVEWIKWPEVTAAAFTAEGAEDWRNSVKAGVAALNSEMAQGAAWLKGFKAPVLKSPPVAHNP